MRRVVAYYLRAVAAGQAGQAMIPFSSVASTTISVLLQTALFPLTHALTYLMSDTPFHKTGVQYDEWHHFSVDLLVKVVNRNVLHFFCD